jgi:hypothetical protein
LCRELGGQGVRLTGSPMNMSDRELFSQCVRMTKSFVDKKFVDGVRWTGSWVNKLNRELF